jgi:hypothetical protein
MDLNITNLKLHLNIESDYSDDNTILQSFLDSATLAVWNYLDIDSGVTLYPNNINQAIILLAAHFYNNRNMISMAQGTELPYTFKFLLSPYKSITII